MTVNELILINSDKVRRDSSLMAFYVESFFSAMGYRPVCAGCSFNTDWRKFVNKINGKPESSETPIKNNIPMSTFKLKKVQNKILSYKADGKTYRQYDNILSENFVNGFLSNGTKEQIQERKELFSVLPEAFQVKVKEVKPNAKNVVKTAVDQAKEDFKTPVIK